MAEAATGSTAPIVSASGRKPTLLFLDDAQYRMNQFKRLLAQVPVKITWASTAKEAIAALRARKYDIVSLDHDLGGKGFEADNDQDIAYIHQHYPGAPIQRTGPNVADGLTVAQALIDTPNVNSRIFIHSMNPVGALHMKNLMPHATVCPWTHVWLEINQIKHFVSQRISR